MHRSLLCIACPCAPRLSSTSERARLPPVAARSGDVGSPSTPHHLRALLRNPHGWTSGTSRPDVLHGVDSSARSHMVEDRVPFPSYLPHDRDPSKVEGNATRAGASRSESQERGNAGARRRVLHAVRHAAETGGVEAGAAARLRRTRHARSPRPRRWERVPDRRSTDASA